MSGTQAQSPSLVASRRQIRRAFGPMAIDQLAEQDRVLTMLVDDMVVHNEHRQAWLALTLMGRLRWLMTGKVR